MKNKKPSVPHFQTLKKKEDNSNLLLFINGQKYTNQICRFTSDFSILDLFFNLLSNVVSITGQFTMPTLISQLTDKQIENAKAFF